MDRIDLFLQETYQVALNNKIPVRVICEDFCRWIVTRYGPREWSSYGKLALYRAFKSNGRYICKKYTNGLHFKGIEYRDANLIHSVPGLRANSHLNIGAPMPNLRAGPRLNVVASVPSPRAAPHLTDVELILGTLLLLYSHCRGYRNVIILQDAI